jgi:zinc D-Ala-D-Ala dipeptidase
MFLFTGLILLSCGAPAPPPMPPQPPPVQAPAPEPEPEPQPKPEPEPEPVYTNAPPAGWVDLAEHIEGIVLEIRYHTARNFTEAPLPGYGVPGAWLRSGPADALAKVHADLAADDLGLLVYDAYRPLRGTLGMVAWAKRTDQVALLDDGYIARRSGHNKGNTIDLTLAVLATGTPLDMGTPWDTLDERSHTRNAVGEALDNRMKLVAAMRAHGWRNYSKEWWHFTFAEQEKLTHRDVPYACFEPPEGTFEAPNGWDRPGFVMPAVWEPSPCPPEGEAGRD